MSVLQVFDPSVKLVVDDEMGSNPNKLPEFYIRGRSGIGVKELDRSDLTRSNLENNPNLPIFIMDGFEVDVEKIYDMDLNRIKNITILKDAAATAMYGSRASNGLIVIETVQPKAGKLRVNYSGSVSLAVPDISDYNLLNAKGQLDAEFASGAYDFTGMNSDKMFEEYHQKLSNVNKGVDIEWMEKPLRNAVNNRHSLFIEGGNKELRFGFDMQLSKNTGVMKGSGRSNKGAGIFINYKMKNLQIQNKFSYNIVKSENSPYGNFATYTKIKPYYEMYDSSNSLVQYFPATNIGNLASGRSNPLYRAKYYNNYSTREYHEVVNNLSLNWQIRPELRLKAQVALRRKTTDSRSFIDPKDISANFQAGYRGSLNLDSGVGTSINTNFLLTYVKTINGHSINGTLGLNTVENMVELQKAKFLGFPSGNLSSPNYAQKIYKKPSFTDNHTKLLGGFLTLNYTYKGIYLFDASYRVDGSSEFGSEKKFAPFWSTGFGVNLHKYNFLENSKWISRVKLRGSLGQTGSVNFSRYAAKNTYDILNMPYTNWSGIYLNYMGNESLKWQKKKKTDIGFDLGLLKDRINVRASVYKELTVDMIADITLPLSSGFRSYKDNSGEVENKGFEFDLRASIVKNKNIGLSLFGSVRHNKGKILKISDSLREYNDRVNEFYGQYDESNFAVKSDPKYGKPFMKYVEGGSLTSIYGMKSLGINPANGQEVFLRKDGSITYDWAASDQVIIGNKEADIHGSFGFNIRFKQLSLHTSFLYTLGADYYNYTLMNKVECVNIAANRADERALLERWQKPGDVTPLKDISDREFTTRPTSRFLQKQNYVKFTSLSLRYNLNEKFCNKLGVSMCHIQLGMNDIFTLSTVRVERGTSYPYAKNFNFTLNASF